VTTTKPTVIFDGECDFCIASLRWVQKKAVVEAISFHDAPLPAYGLTKEQCSKEVIVLAAGEKYAGAAAISYLLALRGNRITSEIIRGLGPLSRSAYRWIAGHRNSLIVRLATRYLNWLT
jgi:predicted DCC family thiol-disulfide oxidoreductase YuxK